MSEYHHKKLGDFACKIIMRLRSSHKFNYQTQVRRSKVTAQHRIEDI